jgi:hypothetical protein
MAENKRRIACTLHIPIEIRTWLNKRANENVRSINGEMTFLLTELKDHLESGTSRLLE